MTVSLVRTITPEQLSLLFTAGLPSAVSPLVGGYGRWRTSEPVTIFDSKLLHDSQPLLWDDAEVSGSGTGSAHSTAGAATTMSVSNATAGKRVRQTYRRFNYQPGKSQVVYLTFNEFSTDTGIRKEVGFFDDDNGLFFRSDEGTLKVVRKTSVSGSAVDNEVDQKDWNIDPLDGKGPSKVTLDLTTMQIGVIDFEWLGAGRVRMGFMVGGIVRYCHEFSNANVLKNVYTSTPNQPVRYSIENLGAGSADNFIHICSTVISEGGQDTTGIVRYASTAGTHVDCATENTIYAIIGIRLKSTHLDQSIRLLNASLAFQTASHHVEWILKFNPTVAGTFTYSNVDQSGAQVATGATANTVTGGVDMEGGFADSLGFFSRRIGSVETSLNSSMMLGSLIDGTPSEIVLCARPVGSSTNVDIEGSLTWRELS